MKHLVCTATRYEHDSGLNHIGEYGQYLFCKKHETKREWGYKPTDIEINNDDIPCYIMKRIAKSKYSAYGDSSVYTAIPMRKKLINAFQECAITYGWMSKRQARKWARRIADCYFGRDGKAIPEMIEAFSDWYNCDYSQANFDDFAMTEISYW